MGIVTLNLSKCDRKVGVILRQGQQDILFVIPSGVERRLLDWKKIDLDKIDKS